jgi:hypothetical protein
LHLPAPPIPGDAFTGNVFNAHFPGKTFSRRLLALYDSHHLARPPAQDALAHLERGRGRPLERGRPPTVFCLGNRGAKVLRAVGVELPKTDFDNKATELSPFGLSHMLLTSEVVATFLAGLEHNPQLELVRILRDGELRVSVSYFDGRNQATGTVQPDATLILRETDGSVTALLLEADRDTMPGERTDHTQSDFLKKCRRYLAWWQDAPRVRDTLHTDDFFVLTVTTTPQHARALQAVARHADPKERGTDLFWFTSRDELAADTVLTAPIWITAAGKTVSLYGEE